MRAYALSALFALGAGAVDDICVISNVDLDGKQQCKNMTDPKKVPLIDGKCYDSEKYRLLPPHTRPHFQIAKCNAAHDTILISSFLDEKCHIPDERIRPFHWSTSDCKQERGTGFYPIDTQIKCGSCAAPPTPPSKCKDIVALAQSVPDLSTLVKAVVAGGLVDTLKGPGPFTVFAPTNEAFASLPAGTLEKLLKPENKKELDDILLYHVLNAKVLSSDLKDGEVAKTVEGKSVTVHIYSTGAIKINKATVQQANVLACNGVVHVIDSVLLPPH
jgi:uncharacterized surface protein with fasciclin (FAS1) repeats